MTQPCPDCFHELHPLRRCPEIVGSSGAPMPDPVYCECADAGAMEAEIRRLSARAAERTEDREPSDYHTGPCVYVCGTCGLAAERTETAGLDVKRLAEAMDAVMPGLRGETVACEHGSNDKRYWPLGDPSGDGVAPGDFSALVAAAYADASSVIATEPRESGCRRAISAICERHGGVWLRAFDSCDASPRRALAADPRPPWPSRDEFRRMSAAEVNDYLASIGVSNRVAVARPEPPRAGEPGG